MNQTMKLRDLIFAALMVALGIILPIALHSFNVSNIILPMHIPVLLAGFVLPWHLALMVGVLTPVLSSVLTGMPPVMPMLPIMVVELGVYALFASILYHRLDLHPILSLLITMVLGRLAASLVVWVMVSQFGVQFMGPVAFFTSAVVTGLPGIIIQLILVPLILAMIPARVRRRDA